MKNIKIVHDNQELFLSVIIPAFNEQERIADTLYLLKDYLVKQPFDSEIIVVDDGSNDMTLEVVRVVDHYSQEFKDQPKTVLMKNYKNLGKGFSIARGMMEAKGSLIMFSDADLATPIEELEKLFPYIESGCDIVVGSRKKNNANLVKNSFLRQVLSAVFSYLVKLLSIKEVKDTQCGFKIYTKEAAKSIAAHQKIQGFGFDVEHLYIAHKLGYKIQEVGVRWEHQEGSSVNLVKDSINMVMELLKIRFCHWRLNASSVTKTAL